MAQSFRTSLLPEAVFLSVRGFNYRMEREGDKCVWAFDVDGRDPASEAQSFRSGSARIEPNRFARELAHMRNSMYDFLDAA